jgi:hypothetical protein
VLHTTEPGAVQGFLAGLIRDLTGAGIAPVAADCRIKRGAMTKLVQDWDSVYDLYASRDWLRALVVLNIPKMCWPEFISIASSGSCSSGPRVLAWNHPFQ